VEGREISMSKLCVGYESSVLSRSVVKYHTAGATAQTSVTVEEHAPGAMYADPTVIEHKAAASTGDKYTLITSTTLKKKNGKVRSV
jgi:hypothetical protein